MSGEKLLDEMTFKLGLDAKRRLQGLAEADGLTASELVRRLIGMPRRTANSGAMTRVWAAVLSMEVGAVFTARELLAAHPDLAHGTYPEKSVGRCLGYLIGRGGVVLAYKRVRHGECHAASFYRRVADDLSRPAPRSRERVVVPDGVRHVRLMDTHRPFREPRTDRPWRGYTSSLAFLG